MGACVCIANARIYRSELLHAYVPASLAGATGYQCINFISLLLIYAMARIILHVWLYVCMYV